MTGRYDSGLRLFTPLVYIAFVNMTLRNDELSLTFNESDIIDDMTKKSLFLYTRLTKGTNDVIVTIMNKKKRTLGPTSIR